MIDHFNRIDGWNRQVMHNSNIKFNVSISKQKYMYPVSIVNSLTFL